MRLSDFIRARAGVIAGQWVQSPKARAPALGDQVGKILLVVADDMENPSGDAQHAAARGLLPGGHLGVDQLVVEFGALREDVLRLWSEVPQQAGNHALAEVMRFDRAMDRVLAESVEELSRKLDESMNRSLAVIGHDLRNSLGAISMSAGVLSRSGNLPGELAKPVGGILTTVARMKYLVIDLEDLARVRLGRGMPIKRASVDIEAICRPVLKDIEAINPDFLIRFDSSGDLSGNWDGARIGHALGNLVRHAAQYGSFRAPIVVSAQGRSEEVVLSVGNQGLPMPAHPLHAGPDRLIQDRPWEADSRDGASGFHLGLYIASEIVAAHGGTIDVSSSQTEGTVFTLRLPRDPARAG
jgi:signal transduction histidine kinase